MFGPVVDVIFPIFGLLMVGYITVMLGWFDQTAIRGLTRFVFDFAVPMLLLRTVSTAQLPEDIPWNFLTSYYLATMHRSHESIGYAMYYTSITIIIGFSILVFSKFIPSIYFGLLTGLAMLIALLAALTLLPQLLIIIKPFGAEKQ